MGKTPRARRRTIREIGKTAKRAWRKTSARRKIRGILGPRGKVISEKGEAKLNENTENMIKGKRTGPTIPETIVRMSVKYTLDSMNVKDRETRDRIFEIMQMYYQRMENTMVLYRRKLQPVFISVTRNDLASVLGQQRAKKFWRTYLKKGWKIRKWLTPI